MISVDLDIKSWKKAADNLGLDKNLSYCILNKTNMDSLENTFRIQNYPSCMILGKNNELKSFYSLSAKMLTREWINSLLDLKKDTKPSAIPLPPPPPANLD